MIKGIFGVNVAVKDLDAAVKTYKQALGIEPTMLGPGDFAFPNLHGAVFDLGNAVINVIASLTDDTSIGKFVAAKGEGLFLLSLRSDDCDADVAEFRNRGVKLLMDKTAAGNFGKVNFIHPKSMHGVQVEIYEPPAGK